MKSREIVLVIGGAGYIGSHMVAVLKKSGYFPIVLDNLSTGTKESVSGTVFFEGNASDEELIEKIHQQYKFTAVIHFAAFLQVGESVHQPLKYYENNVGCTIKLLSVLQKLNVKKFVFSSSCAVYGAPQSDAPITEVQGKFPINPYGRTKWMMEQILQDCSLLPEGLNVVSLRYFNVAGGDPEIFAGVRRVPPTNLIPVILQAVLGGKTVKVFGNDYETPDGTCIRDYIDVVDLCEAHYKALTLLNSVGNEQKGSYRAINLGTGKGHSVLDVIKAACEVTGKEIPFEVIERRQGDPAKLVANAKLAEKVLGWKPERSEIREIVSSAWVYERNRAEGRKQTAEEKMGHESQKAPVLAGVSTFQPAPSPQAVSNSEPQPRTRKLSVYYV